MSFNVTWMSMQFKLIVEIILLFSSFEPIIFLTFVLRHKSSHQTLTCRRYDLVYINTQEKIFSENIHVPLIILIFLCKIHIKDVKDGIPIDLQNKFTYKRCVFQQYICIPTKTKCFQRLVRIIYMRLTSYNMYKSFRE